MRLAAFEYLARRSMTALCRVTAVLPACGQLVPPRLGERAAIRCGPGRARMVLWTPAREVVALEDNAELGSNQRALQLRGLTIVLENAVDSYIRAATAYEEAFEKEWNRSPRSGGGGTG